MKSMMQYVEFLMLGLFVILVLDTAAKAIPMLFVPLFTGLVFVIAVVVLNRIGK